MFLSYQLLTKLFHPNMLTKTFYVEKIDLLSYENHYCLITNLQNFCGNKEHYKHLCRRCLNTYGDQTKLEEHMLRYIEKKVCNISYMHPKQKIKFKDSYIKRDPPMCMAADFECMNVPINDKDNDNDNGNVTETLFVSKPVGIGYNIVKNHDYEKINLEKVGYIKYFGKDCVEWSINDMLEIEGYMKNYCKKERKIMRFPEIYDQSTCWLNRKDFKLKDVKENPVVKDHCHLTGR